eukprot:TRINITY_DN12405_c0_g2_i1.p1 TRINITY_DN12405_c0_g2~~TRINITY_DN12405_c0_g2_i1.p1  ORF type:complete len:174 (-),score=19.63 TRINITY_DN12405_c0_g2_i1:44-565(-)
MARNPTRCITSGPRPMTALNVLAIVTLVSVVMPASGMRVKFRAVVAADESPVGGSDDERVIWDGGGDGISGRVATPTSRVCVAMGDSSAQTAIFEDPGAGAQLQPYFGEPLLKDLRYIFTFVVGVGFARAFEVARACWQCPCIEDFESSSRILPDPTTASPSAQKFNIYQYAL